MDQEKLQAYADIEDLKKRVKALEKAVKDLTADKQPVHAVAKK